MCDNQVPRSRPPALYPYHCPANLAAPLRGCDNLPTVSPHTCSNVYDAQLMVDRKDKGSGSSSVINGQLHWQRFLPPG